MPNEIWIRRCKDCGEDFEVHGVLLDRASARGEEAPLRCPNCAALSHARKARMPLPYVEATIGRERALDPFELTLGRVQHPDPHPRSETRKVDLTGWSFTISDEDIDSVLQALEDVQVAIVVAGTGAGKSTRLVHGLAFGTPTRTGLASRGQVVVTQPRITAVERVARSLANLAGSGVGRGHLIGMRHSKAAESDGRNLLVVETDGTTLQRMKTGDLSSTSLLVIDEAHERNGNMEAILARLADLLHRFPDTRLLIASATIDPHPFAAQFGGAGKVAVFEFAGSPKEISLHWCPHDQALLYDHRRESVTRANQAALATLSAVVDAMVERTHPWGDVLVFVPTQANVEQGVMQAEDMLRQRHPKLSVRVLPLHRSLSEAAKAEACDPRPADVDLKIVFATPLAETSLTISGLVHVVDTGLSVRRRFDTDTMTERYRVGPHTQAGIRQRWGRVGRTSPGHVWTTYTQEQFKAFQEHAPSGLQDTNLEQVLLDLAASGVRDFENVSFNEPVNGREQSRALGALQTMGLIDADGQLTRQGLEVSALPLPRPHAHLLVHADRLGCALEAALYLSIAPVYNRVLTWNPSWDGPSKAAVTERRHLLAHCCSDDLDLAIKIAAGWLGLLPRQDASGEAWACRYGLDELALAEFERSWTKLWAKLAGRKRSEERRSPNAYLVERLRHLIALLMKDSVYTQTEGGLIRDTPGGRQGLRPSGFTVIQRGEARRILATGETHGGRDGEINVANGQLLVACPDTDGWNPTSHLSVALQIRQAMQQREITDAFPDQQVPLGSYVTVRGGEVRDIHYPHPLMLVDMRTRKQPPRVRPAALAIGSSGTTIVCMQSGDEHADGGGVVVGVNRGRTLVDGERASTDALRVFQERHPVGTCVEMTVLRAIQFQDGTAGLQVRHEISGVVTVLGPEHLGAVPDNCVAQQLKIGTKIEVTVEEVVPEVCRLAVSWLPTVARDLDQLIERGSGSLEAVVVSGDGRHPAVLVTGTRPGVVHWFPLWSRNAPPDGTVLVQMQPAEETERRVLLPSPDEALVAAIGKHPSLTYHRTRGVLFIRGRMTHAVLAELLNATQDSVARSALHELWRGTSQPALAVEEAEGAARFLATHGPGDCTRARILATGGAYAVIDVGYGIRGKILRRDLPTGRRPDEVGRCGEIIDIWLRMVTAEKGELTACPFDWMKRYRDFRAAYPPGTRLTGTIAGISECGLFVSLPGSLTGLVHRSTLQRPTPFPVGERGDRVVVMVAWVDIERGRIGLRLADNEGTDRAPASRCGRCIGRATTRVGSRT